MTQFTVTFEINDERAPELSSDDLHELLCTMIYEDDKKSGSKLMGCVEDIKVIKSEA